jgi:hypothetical protein
MPISNYLRANQDRLRINSINAADVRGMSPGRVKDVVESLYVGPRIYYYDLEIPPANIKKLVINNEYFLPELYVKFVDTTNVMLDAGFPVDDTFVTAFVPSGSDTLKNVLMNFKIVEFSIENDDSGVRYMEIRGVGDVSGLFVKEHASYKDQTSWNTLRKVAEQVGLGFASNIRETKDSMTWINPGLDRNEFVQDVVKRSWTGDGSFLWTYVDMYYNLNFVDVELALQEDAYAGKDVLAFPTNKPAQEPNEVVAPIMLSNDKGMQGTNRYFRYFSIVNRSTRMSLKNGYRKVVYYYDKFGNWKQRAGTFLSLEVDSITSPGAEGSSVILKGMPGDDLFFEQNVGFHYGGKMDNSNVHENFNYAYVQNSQNINDLQKVSVRVHLPKPNFGLYRFQKVPVVFSNQSVQLTQAEANVRLSGQWLITGITYQYNSRNKLEQIVTMVKRELNVTDLTL